MTIQDLYEWAVENGATHLPILDAADEANMLDLPEIVEREVYVPIKRGYEVRTVVELY